LCVNSITNLKSTLNFGWQIASITFAFHCFINVETTAKLLLFKRYKNVFPIQFSTLDLRFVNVGKTFTAIVTSTFK